MSLECAGRTIKMARWVSFGPNLVAEAYLRGPIDAHTGLLVNLIDIDQMLREVVRTENVQAAPDEIVKSVFQKVSAQLPSTFPNLNIAIDKLRLHVSEDFYLEYGR